MSICPKKKDSQLNVESNEDVASASLFTFNEDSIEEPKKQDMVTTI